MLVSPALAERITAILLEALPLGLPHAQIMDRIELARVDVELDELNEVDDGITG